jgi:hypothetical protein
LLRVIVVSLRRRIAGYKGDSRKLRFIPQRSKFVERLAVALSEKQRAIYESVVVSALKKRGEELRIQEILNSNPD